MKKCDAMGQISIKKEQWEFIFLYDRTLFCIKFELSDSMRRFDFHKNSVRYYGMGWDMDVKKERAMKV